MKAKKWKKNVFHEKLLSMVVKSNPVQEVKRKKVAEKSRGATRTFGRGGTILFCKGLGGGEGGFPPFSKIFKKQKCLLKGLKSKKRKF